MDTDVTLKPLVTVLMPVYNAEKHLDEAIMSIRKQTYDLFEFLIINDGSIDQSEEIILAHQAEDNRIRYVKNQKNLQLIATLNKGFHLATGEYIARMDADDIALPNRLLRQVETMERNRDVGICGSWINVFGIKDEIIRYPETNEEILAAMFFYNPFSHPSVMLRKSEIERLQLNYNSAYLQAEDYQLWFQCFNKTGLYNIPEVLLHYRVHESQLGFVAPEASIASTKRLKLEALQLFQEQFTEEESKEWFNIISDQPSLNHLTLDVIQKVCVLNHKYEVVSPHFFERKLAGAWKNCFLEMKSVPFNSTKWYLTSSINKHIKFTIKQKLSIFRKTLFSL
jgi:glycosyltransferase involved in cell wall biosynthesis